MSQVTSRRAFVRRAAYLFAAAQASRGLSLASAADDAPVIVETSPAKSAAS